jgi:proline racemase
MFPRIIFAIDSHTMGEPTRIVVGGIPSVPGRTIFEKKEYIKKHYDDLRRALMLEPRGHRDMFGSILLQACDPRCDLGVVFMDAGSYVNMCGHGTIGAVTVAIETGMVKLTNGKESVLLDTPAGVVEAFPKIEGNKVVEVSFKNVPAYVVKKGLEFNMEGYGTIKTDIAFGGNFFAIMPVGQFGLTIEPKNSNKLIELGVEILKITNEIYKVSHPENPGICTIDLVEFYQDLENGVVRNAVIFGDGQIDRSPCGTGTCAKMAVLYEKGKLKIGQEFVHESIIKTVFTGKLSGETKVAEYNAVIPEITGQAFITGFNQFYIDPMDPLKYGFVLG